MAEVASAVSQGFEKGPSDVGFNRRGDEENIVDWATRVRFEYCDLSIPPRMARNQIKTGLPITNSSSIMKPDCSQMLRCRNVPLQLQRKYVTYLCSCK